MVWKVLYSNLIVYQLSMGINANLGASIQKNLKCDPIVH